MVLLARKIQKERYKNINISSNSDLKESQINKFCKLSDKCKNIMNIVLKEYNPTIIK